MILRADPLAAIANTSTIQGVVAAGRYLDRDTLDDLLAQTRARQQPSGAFLAIQRADGIDAALVATRAALDAGDPLPTEASLFIATYQLASAGELESALAIADLNAHLHADSYLPAAIEELHRALELCPTHPVLASRLEVLET